MIKTAIALASLAFTLTAVAETPAPTAAPTPAAEARTQVRAAKQRGEAMSACQKQATEQNLPPVERKQFLTTCMAAK